MIRTKPEVQPKNHHVGCWLILFFLIIIIGGSIYYLYNNYSKNKEYDNSEKKAWMEIERFDSEENLDSLEKYINNYQHHFPEGRHAEQVMNLKQRVDSERRDWKSLQQNISVEALEDFVREHSDGYFRNIASRMIDSLLYAEAVKEDTYQAYQNYLDSYIDGRFTDKAEARMLALRNGEIGKGEQTKIENTLNTHFDALAQNDKSHLLSTLSNQLESYLGKNDVTHTDVVKYMMSIHEDLNRTISFSFDDVNIKKETIDEQQQFTANFTLKETIEIGDKTEEKQFKTIVLLDDRYRIVSLSMK